MAVQLRGVTYKYQGTLEGEAALRDVSLNIPANSLVLLVGENGSGKSTLLKLLARLQEPNTGDIFIDGAPITFYDLPSIRKHINFLMQSEDIYPLSVKENLLMVVPDRKILGETAQEKMDEALRLGGSEKLVERVGYDAVLNPPVLLAQSLQGCGNGPIGSAALCELEKHTQRRLISMLLMVDEPTSALDPIAERDIFQRFLEKSRGKTTIFVTHRFANLSQHADMIICMKNGGIVEQGRHDDLISVGGEYTRLYNAQLI
ncbi:hypothetical protein AGABI1DRAFT_67884 [Agaricus bisporus var. burnettii JB137-S8]|uniref:ABC transporter domain-containing protein n=1 Tax=Agaricus bisporus var. burnettii (strain JB137-S8 / ATCC MYA-4627 / FGSC 10392) TaxID=597362 RepID=K5X381_AGABU|nr:uncharacterized protein AGABI1DRAFT_67884 [Agaricus bisporus var. burnettii JB137-S8]EKM82296.1 hypothetical protein AGABI1DRAFT_67884 [Agaricus bisporus var. burnettii JB137-S8]